MKKQLRAHYLFNKTSLPKEISDGIADSIEKLDDITDNVEYLEQAYEVITRNYEGGRGRTFSRIFDLLSTGAEDLWNRSGFLHCTNQNYLLSLLLVKGGGFSEDDIEAKWTMIWYISPHQYLRIKVDDQYIDVDCWARHYGVGFGKYATGFNTSINKKFANK